MSQPAAYPKTRRIRFRFGDDGNTHKYFVENDIVYSHFVAGLSGGFPPGEEGFIRSVRKYLRPGFHPDDLDTDALLKRWQQELFGADGVLVDHLK